MTRLIGCVVGVGLALASVDASAQDRQTRIQSWPFAPDGAVRIVNPAGRVRVLGWDTDSLSVSGPGTKRVSVAGDARVKKIVATDSKQAVELEVHVSRRASVWVKTTTAGVEVEGMDGALDLNSVGGTIHVIGTPADVTAETMDGAVEIAGGTGRARVKTVSGPILLRGASVDLGASTLSGTIVVRAAGWQRGGTGVQRGKFESVSGGVRFDGEVGRGGILELESQSGAIELRVPRSAVADFDLLTIAGSIRNGLTSSVAQPRGGGGGGGTELKFSTGTGGEGAQVTVRTFKGTISLDAK